MRVDCGGGEIRVPNISSAGEGVTVRVRVIFLSLRHHNYRGFLSPKIFSWTIASTVSVSLALPGHNDLCFRPSCCL